MAFKKVNKNGGFTLPLEMRRSLNINPGDSFEVTYNSHGNILLKRYAARCILCGGDSGVDYFKGKPVCASCAAELSKGKGAAE